MVFRGGNRGRTEKRRPRQEPDKERKPPKQRQEDLLVEESPPDAAPDSDAVSSDDEESDSKRPNAYRTLLETLLPTDPDSTRARKRRRLSGPEEDPSAVEVHTGSGKDDGQPQSGEPVDSEAEPGSDDDADDQDDVDGGQDDHSDDEDAEAADPYNRQFPSVVEPELAAKIKAAATGKFKARTEERNGWKVVESSLSAAESDTAQAPAYASLSALPLKQRLRAATKSIEPPQKTDPVQLLSSLYNYKDTLHASKTATTSLYARQVTSLHILNHVLKGRDRIIRNTAKLAKSDSADDDACRDQGFTRPKILFLLETREQVYNWVLEILRLFEPEQKENWSRFKDAFHAEPHLSATLPEDHLDLFDGNSDNDFRVGLKFTRKTIKFFAAFYGADILFCSPLGLRRVIADPDAKKRDHDFLSSIEVCVLDQAHAMQMQNWAHVTFCMEHLYLQRKAALGTDFKRVKTFYLDSLARHLRQTIVFMSYLTPELNNLFATHARNPAGKVKLHPIHRGVLHALPSPRPPKQTFTRFASSSPTTDPDARFAHFSAAVLPSISKLSSLSSASSPAGILLFVPSYLDFVRVRNHLASAPAAENISFSTLSEYDSVSASRRARSLFAAGRSAVLVYCGRAHFFHRYRVRGVRRVEWFGLPDDEGTYAEVLGMVGEGGSSRAVFGRWDGLKLERIVGAERVRLMVGEKAGDTFDFV